ncbi:MAG: aldehyde ferredoxin oxidoreductase family protein [Thermodesulfobacteriota bacterium]|nr:aldehyde ferredoxin oxidoreductase family protein [Thermodesulfobacteriota bacterium]
MNRKYGRILVVDLKEQSSKPMEIDAEVLKKFVGGSGLAAYLYGKFAEGNVPPLSPASPFIIMTGPMTGTPVMLSGRHGVAGRSPLTGFWGEASVGGHWGRELRRTGYDGLVLVEQSAKPVTLSLMNEKMDIKEASHLWGKDCFETDSLLKKEWGEKAQICSIGPAGEKMVRFAGVFTDGPHARVAARCGLGALMGSKKVKAIVVKGSYEIPVENISSLRESVKELMPSFTGKLKGMSTFGTPGLVVPCEAIGDLPIKNWSQGKWTEGAKKISGQELNEKYLKKQFFCASCPVGCGRTVGGTIDPFLEETGGPEYETLGMLGSNCLIDDLPSIMRLNELTNRLGLDTIETGAVVAFTMDLLANGLIGSKELGSLSLNWGNAAGAEGLIRMIAGREGFGDLLAEGLQVTAEKLGGMAPEYAIQANNMALPAHDPRAYASIALGYATSNRGPCHTAGFTHIFERATIFPEVGIDRVMDRFQFEGKGEMVMKAQNIMNLWENLALCKFSIFGGLHLQHIGRWLKDICGWDLSIQDLIEVGERSFTAKRMLNVGWGMSRKNDTLPLRVITHRVSDGGAGNHLPPFNIMLADYYEKRGWTKEGIPTEDILKRLNL